MDKTYDIRNIDELHRLRADHYEETKHLSREEFLRQSNENGRRIWEEMQARKREKMSAAQIN